MKNSNLVQSLLVKVLAFLCCRKLICHFTVIIFLGSVRHLPVSSSELDDLQQQELGQGAEPLLQKETISKKGEELIHPLGVHLLQLLTDAVELQDQAVHLEKEEQMAEHKAMEAPLHSPGCAFYRSLAGQQEHQQLFPALTSSSFCRLSGCASRNRQSYTGFTRAIMGMLFTCKERGTLSAWGQKGVCSYFIQLFPYCSPKEKGAGFSFAVLVGFASEIRHLSLQEAEELNK